MSTPHGHAHEQRGGGETEKERRDRELIEMLNELRVALPGIQVLFAFLLTIPFTNAFEQTTSTQRAAFFTAFLGATAASLLLIAPTVFHRLRFREGSKEDLLRASNVSAIAGMAFLALSMTATVFLITDVVYGAPVSVLVGLATGVAFATYWFLFPRTFSPEEERR